MGSFTWIDLVILAVCHTEAPTKILSSEMAYIGNTEVQRLFKDYKFFWVHIYFFSEK